MGVVVIIVVTAIGAIALSVLARVLVTGLTARAQDMAATHPYRSFFAGALSLLFVTALVAVFVGEGPIGLVAVPFVTVAAVTIWLGTGAVSGAVGLKLLKLAGRDASDPVRSTAAGASLMCVSLGVPFLGWAIVAAVMVAGVGAIWGALFVGKSGSETPGESSERGADEAGSA